MTIEHAQIILQVISVIGVPILTAMITWITRSLQKTNKRIDEIEEKHYQARMEDMERKGELSERIKAMEAKQEANLREMQIIRTTLSRIEDFLREK